MSGGGFIPPSPAPSSSASSHVPSTLPHPRTTPLKSGGSKESTFIRYVDQQILHIQRRFAKRDAPRDEKTRIKETDEEGRVIEEVDDLATTARLQRSEEWNDVRGYNSFAEAARDMEELIAVIWVSGTPSLQTPYLINMALLVNTLIPAFPASPRQMFRLLDKLDHAFASLLLGKDVESGEHLPGFQTGRRVSTTEKVRIRSLLERTRRAVAVAISGGDFEDEEEEEEDVQEDLDGDLILDTETRGPEREDWQMQAAKVYDRTLVELGEETSWNTS